MDCVLSRRTGLLCTVAAALGAWLPAAHAAGDATAGAAVFATHCAECHSLREGKDKKGPSLFAVFGKPAGGRPGYVYSDALKAAGLSWSADNLDAYLRAPAQKVPGGKMKYDGLPSATDRADLIAYLQAQGAR